MSGRVSGRVRRRRAPARASALLAGLAVLAGVSFLLAPTLLALWRRSEADRAARVREAERADIAAHLHDSVLQTLALIQRRPERGLAVEPIGVVRHPIGRRRLADAGRRAPHHGER